MPRSKGSVKPPEKPAPRAAKPSSPAPSTELRVHPAKIADFVPDSRNANLGTERGMQQLEFSLQQFGPGRSVLADKNGVLIAGNKTAEKAGAIGIEDVIVVHTTGDKLVVVQRDDIDINTPQGRNMAIADNVVSQHNLEWDAPVLSALIDEQLVTLTDWWTPAEYVSHIDAFRDDLVPATGLGSTKQNPNKVTIILSEHARELWNSAVKSLGAAEVAKRLEAWLEILCGND